MLIDGQTIITGSFNFTTNAEQHNAENLLVIRNRPDLYQAYQNNFRHHYEHSQPYQGRGTGSPQPAHGVPPADLGCFGRARKDKSQLPHIRFPAVLARGRQ